MMKHFIEDQRLSDLPKVTAVKYSCFSTYDGVTFQLALKMHLMHLTYQTQHLSLAYLKHAQNIVSKKHCGVLAVDPHDCGAD